MCTFKMKGKELDYPNKYFFNFKLRSKLKFKFT